MQLDELKEARGARPEDGTVSVDKPLWEVSSHYTFFQKSLPTIPTAM
jgi:hypothetical protein